MPRPAQNAAYCPGGLQNGSVQTVGAVTSEIVRANLQPNSVYLAIVEIAGRSTAGGTAGKGCVKRADVVVSTDANGNVTLLGGSDPVDFTDAAIAGVAAVVSVATAGALIAQGQGAAGLTMDWAASVQIRLLAQ